jgi:hypothetical protein
VTQPDAVHGAWTRRWMTVDGGPAFETQHVVWLQAGPCYADLRVPFHPEAVPRCFAGRSGWIGEHYRWTHTLDLEGADAPSADDVGELEWRDGALVETGRFPTATGAVAYVEVWDRLPGAEGSWAAHEAPGCCLVRVGAHALVAAAGPAALAVCYWRQHDGAWRTVRGIGDLAELPTPDDPGDWPLVAHGTTEAVVV